MAQKLGINRLRRVCKCGDMVWDVEGPHRLPTYQEEIICPGCGRDHSRPPGLTWRLRFGLRRLQRRIRLNGYRETWRRGSRDAFLLDRERKELADAPQQAQEKNREAHI